jgi:hypothetical protein
MASREKKGQDMKAKPDVFDEINTTKSQINVKSSFLSDIEKQLFMTEIAMWALKQVIADDKLRGGQKTKVIRSFFARFRGE